MDDAIQLIRGRHLSSVVSVQDYVQLRFDGVCLTVNAPLSVLTTSGLHNTLSPGLADSLRDRIGQSVRRASALENERILIELTDDSQIEISLRDEDQVSPEAVVITNEDGMSVVW